MRAWTVAAEVLRASRPWCLLATSIGGLFGCQSVTPDASSSARNEVVALPRPGGDSTDAGDGCDRFAAMAGLPENELLNAIAATVNAPRSDGAASRIPLELLPERSSIYTAARGPREVARIRAYLFTVLADLGPPPEALPVILAELQHGHDPRSLGAAAHAAGAMGDAGEPLVPALCALLGPRLHDDRFDLEHLSPSRDGPAASTTARIETVRALARIGGPTGVIRAALRPDQWESESSPFYGNSALQAEARIALAGLSTEDCCCAAETPRELRDALVEPWRDADRRILLLDQDIALIDQADRALTLRDLLGKPVALTSFYTRCENPNKCPVTMAHLGRLQAALREQRMADRVTLAAITLDPEFDTPSRLRRFAARYGVQPGASTLLLRSRTEDLEPLVKSLGLSVTFGDGQVGAHGVELLLFDASGRYVRRHKHVVWDTDGAVRDLQALIRERDIVDPS